MTNGVVEVVCEIGSLIKVTSTTSFKNTSDQYTRLFVAFVEPLIINPEALLFSFEKTESFVDCDGEMVGKFPP